MSTILTKVLETIIAKVLSYLGAYVIEWLDDKRDNKEIDDAFKNPNEGGVASDLNDVFTD